MSKKKNRMGNSEEILSNIGNRMSNQKTKNENDSTNKEKENSSTKTESENNSWFNDQEPYRSSFIIKPKMENNFNQCKNKFRSQFRMNLSKQNAIELGWLLLKNLDDKFFEEVKATSSPDDDLIKELKKVINEYF